MNGDAMRKFLTAALLSFSLLGSFTYVLAQSSPVPALPDAERRTEYSVTGSAGPFDVGFALYGSGSDYQNWLQVYVNGVATTAYTLTSPSGTIGILALPITDAQITFSSSQTGTVEIVGAQRPRRTSQLSENRGVSAHDFNVIVTSIISMIRERWDTVTEQVIRVPPGETAPMLPPAASRANMNLTFDASGNPTASLAASGTVNISAAMQPVVESATTSAAAALLGVSNDPVGTVKQYAGFTAPTGYDFPYGQAYSRITFAALESAITISESGTCTATSTTISGLSSTAQMAVGQAIESGSILAGSTIATIPNSTSITISAPATASGTCAVQVFPWGNGDGSTTFNLPDLRGRIAAAPDAMGGTAASRLTSTYYGTAASTPAISGGSQHFADSITIAQANLPAVAPTFSGTAATITVNSTGSGFAEATGGALTIAGTGTVGYATVNSTGSYTPAGTISNLGSGTAIARDITTVQPTLTMNYIIRVTP